MLIPSRLKSLSSSCSYSKPRCSTKTSVSCCPCPSGGSFGTPKTILPRLTLITSQPFKALGPCKTEAACKARGSFISWICLLKIVAIKMYFQIMINVHIYFDLFQNVIRSIYYYFIIILLYYYFIITLLYYYFIIILLYYYFIIILLYYYFIIILLYYYFIIFLFSS